MSKNKFVKIRVIRGHFFLLFFVDIFLFVFRGPFLYYFVVRGFLKNQAFVFEAFGSEINQYSDLQICGF